MNHPVPAGNFLLKNRLLPLETQEQSPRNRPWVVPFSGRVRWLRRRRDVIRKLKSGEYRLYSRKKGEDGKRRNLGTFPTRDAAEKHERDVQYFKKH